MMDFASADAIFSSSALIISIIIFVLCRLFREYDFFYISKKIIILIMIMIVIPYTAYNFKLPNKQMFTRHSGNYYELTAAELAAEILARGNITYPFTSTGGYRAQAKQNLVDTSNGKKAYGNGGKRVALSRSLLVAILLLNDEYGNLGINSLAGGVHSFGSNHYYGVAADFHNVGSQKYRGYQINRNLTKFLKNNGFVLIDFGGNAMEENRHIHIAIKSHRELGANFNFDLFVSR